MCRLWLNASVFIYALCYIYMKHMKYMIYIIDIISINIWYIYYIDIMIWLWQMQIDMNLINYLIRKRYECQLHKPVNTVWRFSILFNTSQVNIYTYAALIRGNVAKVRHIWVQYTLNKFNISITLFYRKANYDANLGRVLYTKIMRRPKSISFLNKGYPVHETNLIHIVWFVH